MNSTQNKKIEQVKETTMIVGSDVGSEERLTGEASIITHSKGFMIVFSPPEWCPYHGQPGHGRWIIHQSFIIICIQERRFLRWRSKLRGEKDKRTVNCISRKVKMEDEKNGDGCIMKVMDNT